MTTETTGSKNNVVCYYQYCFITGLQYNNTFFYLLSPWIREINCIRKAACWL